MKFWKQMILFCVGGGAYVGLELLWRGRSHSSMFAAGGTCFLLIGHLNHVRPRLPLPLRTLAGAGIITMVERITDERILRRIHNFVELWYAKA